MINIMDNDYVFDGDTTYILFLIYNHMRTIYLETFILITKFFRF